MSFALLADPTRGADAMGAMQGRVGRGDSGCRGELPTHGGQQHLSKPRFAGLIEAQRQGQRMMRIGAQSGPAPPRPASYQAEGPRLTLGRRRWLQANYAVISFRAGPARRDPGGIGRGWG
jgi:hypothetical protein